MGERKKRVEAGEINFTVGFMTQKSASKGGALSADILGTRGVCLNGKQNTTHRHTKSEDYFPFNSTQTLLLMNLC